MKTLTVKMGDKITASIMGQLTTGAVKGFGEHKGKQVVDFIEASILL